jgi:hypothetical protein
LNFGVYRYFSYFQEQKPLRKRIMERSKAVEKVAANLEILKKGLADAEKLMKNLKKGVDDTIALIQAFNEVGEEEEEEKESREEEDDDKEEEEEEEEEQEEGQLKSQRQQRQRQQPTGELCLMGEAAHEGRVLCTVQVCRKTTTFINVASCAKHMLAHAGVAPGRRVSLPAREEAVQLVVAIKGNDIGQAYLCCPVQGCVEQCRRATSLAEHLATVHGQRNRRIPVILCAM